MNLKKEFDNPDVHWTVALLIFLYLLPLLAALKVVSMLKGEQK